MPWYPLFTHYARCLEQPLPRPHQQCPDHGPTPCLICHGCSQKTLYQNSKGIFDNMFILVISGLTHYFNLGRQHFVLSTEHKCIFTDSTSLFFIYSVLSFTGPYVFSCPLMLILMIASQRIMFLFHFLFVFFENRAKPWHSRNVLCSKHIVKNKKIKLIGTALSSLLLPSTPCSSWYLIENFR